VIRVEFLSNMMLWSHWYSIKALNMFQQLSMSRKKRILNLVPKHSQPTNLCWAKTHKAEYIQFLWVAGACIWSLRTYMYPNFGRWFEWQIGYRKYF